MNARTYAGGRNTKYAYSRTISRGTLESTFELDSTEPVVEFEWGYGVASVNFPGRYYTVRKVGDQWCGSCRDERIRPLHIKAVLEFIAAKEAVTSEVTASQVEMQGTLIPAKTTIYHVGGRVVFYIAHFQCWFCTCNQPDSGHCVSGCQHIERVISAKQAVAA